MSETQDVAASSRGYVFGLAALAFVCLGLLVWTAFAVSLEGALVAFVPLIGGLAWGMYKTCYQVEVSDGYLVMRYLHRRRVVRLDFVRRIEFIEQDDEIHSPAKFDVALHDGTCFRVAANETTLRLMNSVVQRRPDVALTGETWPNPERFTAPRRDPPQNLQFG